MKSLPFVYGIALLFISCSKPQTQLFEVRDFNPVSNFQPEGDTLYYMVDLKNAITNGIIIPTENGDAANFVVRFKIQNTSETAKKYAYKVFYQNESYAFPPLKDGILGEKLDPKANDNFYGSWNMANSGFHQTQEIAAGQDFVEITDTIAILGNPRNEAKYFGAATTNPVHTYDRLPEVIQSIRNSPEWLKSMEEKAAKANISVDAQIEADARWMIQHEGQQGDENNRWKRNPRMGTYSFLLVVTEADKLDQIPYFYRDVTMKDSTEKAYKNPYYYFLETDDNEDTFTAQLANTYVKAKLKYDVSSGIYVNPFAESDMQTDFLNTHCNDSDSMFYHAQFQQYFHYIDKNKILHNIPMAYDVTGADYSRAQYDQNVAKFPASALTGDFVDISHHAGKTVGYDSSQSALTITNPGNNDSSAFGKLNVGLRTRYGLTYGKYTARIEFPETISHDGVWNGLTCAYWLIYQTGDWNTRSNCESGYNLKLSGDEDRKPSSTYSEIDIEIVKTSKYWPGTSYGDNVDYPVDSGYDKNIIVACTNWDLACQDPPNFNSGVKKRNFQNQEFALHRWDKDYRALTSKYENPHDEIMGKSVFYQIEWRPDAIIWRIGPSKDKLKVICYMDETNTKIPDNQMETVVTQEFHAAEWWPLEPYKQNFIPYPLNDITGYIYSVEIE